MIYKLLFYILHFLIDIFYIVKSIVRRLTNKICYSEFRTTGRFRSNAVNLSKSGYLQLSFNKLPVHIGLVIIEKDISFYDVTKILLWCLSLGIPHISIYDTQGTIKAEYARHLMQNKFLNKASKYKVTLHENGIQIEEHYQNGHQNIRKIYVHLLDREDGRGNIIKAARNFCTEVHSGLKKSSELQQQLFKSYLQENSRTPDPDLVLQFGPLCSMAGFLPWHIYLSEILSLPSHQDIELHEFLDVLCRFSHCEQRFGT